MTYDSEDAERWLRLEIDVENALDAAGGNFDIQQMNASASGEAVADFVLRTDAGQPIAIIDCKSGECKETVQAQVFHDLSERDLGARLTIYVTEDGTSGQFRPGVLNVWTPEGRFDQAGDALKKLEAAQQFLENNPDHQAMMTCTPEAIIEVAKVLWETFTDKALEVASRRDVDTGDPQHTMRSNLDIVIDTADTLAETDSISEPITIVEGVVVDDTAPEEAVARESFDAPGEIVDVEVISIESEAEPIELATTADSSDHSIPIDGTTSVDLISPAESITITETGDHLTNSSADHPHGVTITATEGGLSETGGVGGVATSAIEQHNSSVESSGGFGEHGFEKFGGSHY